MGRALVRTVAVVATLSPFFVSAPGHAQQNGEARSAVPAVIRTDYDMRAFMAPLSLNDSESAGRSLFARRCANCHGGNAQRPGPPLGKPTVERLGESAIRDKVRKGSTMMPGFEHSLDAAQLDQLIAFLKTFTPRSQAATPD
jgi:mono/diheme cytochrome c family protein